MITSLLIIYTYRRLCREIPLDSTADSAPLESPMILVPVQFWFRTDLISEDLRSCNEFFEVGRSCCEFWKGILETSINQKCNFSHKAFYSLFLQTEKNFLFDCMVVL